jgi:hypothetical protein
MRASTLLSTREKLRVDRQPVQPAAPAEGELARRLVWAGSWRPPSQPDHRRVLAALTYLRDESCQRAGGYGVMRGRCRERAEITGLLIEVAALEARDLEEVG